MLAVSAAKGNEIDIRLFIDNQVIAYVQTSININKYLH